MTANTARFSCAQQVVTLITCPTYFTVGEIFPWEVAWGYFGVDTYTYCSITILFLLLQISQLWLLGIRWLRLLYSEVKGQALRLLVSVSFST